MPAKRKKWKITYTGSDATDQFPSEKKTYEHLRLIASLHAHGTAGAAPRVKVWVHEGDSRGWQLFDDPDLSEWAALAGHNSQPKEQ